MLVQKTNLKINLHISLKSQTKFDSNIPVFWNLNKNALVLRNNTKNQNGFVVYAFSHIKTMIKLTPTVIFIRYNIISNCAQSIGS